MGLCAVGLGVEIPFGKELKEAVKREFREEMRVLKTIPIEGMAWNAERGQYDAEKMLAQLAEAKLGCEKVLAVADADLFVPGLNFVFGLSEMSGREGLVSFARLKDEDGALFRERFLKEALHEIGHLRGLGHCTNGKCVMKFSNSLHEVDLKGGSLCARCRKKLGMNSV